MEITELTGVRGSRRVASLKHASTVECSLSPEAKKIGQWVEQLEQMPDIVPTCTLSRPDPATIAQAMAPFLW